MLYSVKNKLPHIGEGLELRGRRPRVPLPASPGSPRVTGDPQGGVREGSACQIPCQWGEELSLTGYHPSGEEVVV